MAKKATKKSTTKKKTTTSKKATVKKSTPKKATTTKKKTEYRPSTSFMRLLTPSKALAEIVGSGPMPRTEVMKKIWGYIKKNDLQDPKNRRSINADDKLRAVFGGKRSVTMFEMTKLVSNHLK